MHNTLSLEEIQKLLDNIPHEIPLKTMSQLMNHPD